MSLRPPPPAPAAKKRKAAPKKRQASEEEEFEIVKEKRASLDEAAGEVAKQLDKGSPAQFAKAVAAMEKATKALEQKEKKLPVPKSEQGKAIYTALAELKDAEPEDRVAIIEEMQLAVVALEKFQVPEHMKKHGAAIMAYARDQAGYQGATVDKVATAVRKYVAEMSRDERELGPVAIAAGPGRAAAAGGRAAPPAQYGGQQQQRQQLAVAPPPPPPYMGLQQQPYMGLPQQQRPRGPCNHCNERGHLARECWNTSMGPPPGTFQGINERRAREGMPPLPKVAAGPWPALPAP